MAQHNTLWARLNVLVSQVRQKKKFASIGEAFTNIFKDCVRWAFRCGVWEPTYKGIGFVWLSYMQAEMWPSSHFLIFNVARVAFMDFVPWDWRLMEIECILVFRGHLAHTFHVEGDPSFCILLVFWIRWHMEVCYKVCILLLTWAFSFIVEHTINIKIYL